MTNNKTSGFLTVATLESGHVIERNLKVGDIVKTQWGPRRVVRVERKPMVKTNPYDGWDNGCQ
jgi:hypothetical protein